MFNIHKATKQSKKIVHRTTQFAKKASEPFLQLIQKDEEWQPISFAFRFSADFEAKYSIKDIEFSTTVQAIEQFKD